MNNLKTKPIKDYKDRWEDLDNSQKKLVIERLVLFWNEEVLRIYQNPVFEGLDFKINFGDFLKSFLTYQEQDIHVIRLALLSLREGIERDKAENDEIIADVKKEKIGILPINNAISFIDRLGQHLGIGLEVMDEDDNILEYWKDYMLANMLIEIGGDGEDSVKADPSMGIIWLFLQAKAECVYGISLGRTYDELEPNLDFLKIGLKKFKKGLKTRQKKETIKTIIYQNKIDEINNLIKEINDFKIYSIYRYTLDVGETLTRKQCQEIAAMTQRKPGKMPKEPGRHIINAITKKEIEMYSKSEEEAFKVESVDSWLRDPKRRDKFIYYNSLKDNLYSNMVHFESEKDKTRLLTDSFIRLSVTNLDEIWNLLMRYDRVPK